MLRHLERAGAQNENPIQLTLAWMKLALVYSFTLLCIN